MTIDNFVLHSPFSRIRLDHHKKQLIGDYELAVVNSINAIPKRAWDALVDDNAFSTYGWLKTVEETFAKPLCSRYILLYKAGQLVGAAICQVVNSKGQGSSLDKFLFGRLARYTRRLKISFLPAVICPIPGGGYGQNLVVTSDAKPDERLAIMSNLLTGLETLARENGLPLCFVNVLGNQHELIALLTKRRYNQTVSNPINYLDICWSSFDEYLKYVGSISQGARKAIRHERNKNRKEEIFITSLQELTGYQDRLHELIDKNCRKHNGISFPFTLDFFPALERNLGKDAVIYAAFKKKQLIGACLLFKLKKVKYVFVVGVDHELDNNGFTYFNIAYYRPIVDAIADKIQRLYFGRGMYEIKMKRGCEVLNTYIFYKSDQQFKHFASTLWFKFHSLWLSYKLPKIVRERMSIRRHT